MFAFIIEICEYGYGKGGGFEMRGSLYCKFYLFNSMFVNEFMALIVITNIRF